MANERGYLMEYDYALTTSYDGELYHTMRTADLLEAVNAWNKINDCGDAKEYATYNLSCPTGKMYTQTHYRNGKVVTK